MRLHCAFLCLILAGCGPTLTYSTTRTEPAKVGKLLYVPSGEGSGLGVGFDGKRTSVVSTDVTIPARYGIVFECDHGSFAVEGSKWKALWQSLHEGDSVTVEYRDEFADGVFRKYDFLGATKVPLPTPGDPPKQ